MTLEPLSIDALRASLQSGCAIPAHPLALTAERKLDERRQRALTRYYLEAGAGGVAVGVHSTQFEIREPQHGLLRPVLSLASEVVREHTRQSGRRALSIAGVCGKTTQAIEEAELARELGYDAILLSLAAMPNASNTELLAHCGRLAEELPVVGFYLQPAAGGRLLDFRFWAEFMTIPSVVAVKIAPFNRYQTFDVVRALAVSGRAGEIALYTGNDDNIVLDLLTPTRISHPDRDDDVIRFVGGLLGHWAVWTRRAVELLQETSTIVASGQDVPVELMTRAIQVTDTNAVFFDAANGFAGCIPGIHEVLRRQGLLEGTWCLDPKEKLSPGQTEDIDRVYLAYPHLNDDDFVASHLDEWLR
jgi:hypothetical protein